MIYFYGNLLNGEAVSREVSVSDRYQLDHNASNPTKTRVDGGDSAKLIARLHLNPKLIKSGNSPPRHQYEFVALWLGTAVTILNKTLNQKFFH